MIALSDKILQIHHFGNKLLIKTDGGLIPLNEYCSFIVECLCCGPMTVQSISRRFVEKFCVDASLEEVQALIQNYISKYSNRLFRTISDYDNTASFCPVLSGSPNRYVPYLLNIELTNTCNLNCSHCYKEANCSKPSNLELCKLKELFTFLDSKNLSITLTGGEPTTHNSFDDIVALCTKFGRVDLVTNGLMLRNIPSATLEKLNLIGISLYGIDDLSYEINTGIKNGFTLLRQSTEYLHSVGKTFVLTIVLDKEKIKNLEKYIDAAAELGASNVQIGLPFRSGKLTEKTNDNEQWLLSKEERRLAYRKIREYQRSKNIRILDWERDVYEKKYAYDDPNNPSNFYKTHCMKCGAGTTQWTISEDFYFRPCNMLNSQLVGKISFDAFKEYVDGELTIRWREYMKKYAEVYLMKYGLQLSDCCKRLTDFIYEER